MSQDAQEELSLPVRPFDWPWEVHETIWPCNHCLVWRAELVFDGPDDALWIREWHAGDCAVWAEIDGVEA